MQAKTVLIPKPHSILPGVTICELWYGGELIGTVTVNGMVMEIRIAAGEGGNQDG